VEAVAPEGDDSGNALDRSLPPGVADQDGHRVGLGEQIAQQVLAQKAGRPGQ